MRSRLTTVGIVLVRLALIVGLSIGGWTLYWFLARSSAGHQATIRRTTFEFQNTYRDEITRKLLDVGTLDVQLATITESAQHAAVAAQRRAIVNIICIDAAKIVGSPLPVDQGAFIGRECTTSPFTTTTN